MNGLVLIVVLGTTVLVGTSIGGRYRVAPPVLLICMGALVALAPPFSNVVLEPDVVLLLFLPAILYRESIAISGREVRANFWVIALLAVVLVGVTMVTVSLSVQALGVAPAAAWVIGAVLSPTDAAAVAGLAKRMPRRLLTTLRAESLVNDGTALVLFSLALGLLGGSAAPGVLELFEDLGGSFLGGIAAGLLVGSVVVLVRKRLDDPLREGALSVLTPFTAFLLAEAVHASGVLGVVVAGLIVSRASPRVIGARARIMAFAFWDLTTFLVNGGLFVLVGMQIPRAIRGVDGPALARSILIAVVVAVVLLATRLVGIHLSALVSRLVDRRQSQRARRINWRVRTVAGWAGFRGAVSLAAALSVPLSTPHGGPVGERDLIIFTTAMVILLTMLVQGTTLPLLLRWAGLQGDPERVEETRQARLRTSESGLARLPDIAARKGSGPEVVERVRSDYQRHLDDFREPEPDAGSATVREEERRLRLAVLEHKRREVTRMRDAREIDDTVLRELQATLDIEEIRLRGPLEFE